ncbi:MAG: PKD domain-containing protein [Thermoplasmata archaeon]|nr:MAG: PKD domain-containing protein [Thermoplasmata archaeon]
MTRSTPSLLIVAMMLISTLVGVLPYSSDTAEALVFDVDSTEDLQGSGTNQAVLDKVVIEGGTVKLDVESYPISDEAWSDGNAMDMVVDGQNKPKLDLASHWTTNPGFDSNGDFMHSAVYDRDNSEVLVYGGVHDTAQNRFVHNTLWSYDGATGIWDEKSPVNRPKFLHTAVWAESLHMMIVFGGITVVGSDIFLLNETLVYWPANDTWALMADCPFGGVVMHTAVWDNVNDQMLVAGGTRDGTMANVTNQLWAFRPGTNSWTRLANFDSNQARGGAASVWDAQNEMMIVFGGQRGNNNPMSSVLSYKPSTNTWNQRSNAPVTRVFHSMSWDPVGNKAYSFGGFTGSAISSRLYEYSPLQDSWRQMENAPDARYWGAFVWDPTNNLGLAFAGAAETGNPPLTSYNDVMVYSTQVPFQTDGWLTSAVYDVGGVVSMGEISWTPTSQSPSVGPDPVKFQVASSSMLETPTNFVGPDGTSNSYFTDPAGTAIGDHHFGAGRVAYRMYFHTDDDTISPSVDTVNMEAFRYASRGTYTSPIYDLGQERSSLERIVYRDEIPQDANPNLVKVTVEIRTSKNPDMSASTGWEEVGKDDTSIDIPYGRYFQFEVTITTDSLKRHLTPSFKGISVEFNSPPILSLGQMDKSSGDRTTWFEYSITYTDVDNDEPVVKYVYIDGTPYEMSSPDQDFTDGAVFSFTTRLNLGEHDYFFEFSDGKNPVRDPPGGSYTGPEVLNRDPIPLIDFPSTGERFTPAEPVEFSASSSWDPDEDDLSFRWISSISGELSTNPAFIKSMVEGDHLITLEVTDEHGSTNSTQISILVKPYLPLLEIRDMYLDKQNPIEKDRVTVNAVVYNEGELAASPAVLEFLVNDELVDSREESLGIGDRMVATFTWTAAGDTNYLKVRARPGHGADPDDERVWTINVTPNSPPVISVDVYPEQAYLDDPVNFVNNGTSDVDGDSLTFLWDFGDGITSPDSTTQHVYTLKGHYTVKLTVTDTRGGVTTEQWFIEVKKKPVEEEPFLSMTVIGGIVAAVIVLLLVAFLVMSRGKKGEDTPDDEVQIPAMAEGQAPRSRPLPPPPPPPPPPPAEEAPIPGSPLEEMDNPYYNYDYGPGVEDPAPPDEGHDVGEDTPYDQPKDAGYDPSAEAPVEPVEETPREDE